ncbi:hypothetical protein Q4574_09870 [Aliiglaciecola sp. 3_MG-2023]|uniref:tetratricopeptide repeat protein n=1 Tax=Aliiglaciecola sp. 3_MG-2023 TaxID=3062644 RepID=UPI0026E2A9D4|nr:hypothetical protein [Aliiglaciecola sp. 3_MG-2023]MDO6693591.1 hypothetical protein [Aliiglaciecola sp. 3_MG-2023]
MIIRLLPFVLISMLLRADSVFSTKFLYNLGTREPQQYSPLFMAAKQKHAGALERLSTLAIEQNQVYWIQKSAEIGSIDALLFLAAHTADTDTKKHYLTRAAKLGDSESQFQLALFASTTSAKVRLLENAASSGHKKAIVSLYYLLNQLGTTDEDNQWLSKAAELNPHLTRVYAALLWNHQSPEVSFQWLANQSDNQEGNVQKLTQDLVANIESMRWQETHQRRSTNDGMKQPLCAMKIQFIAGSLQAITQIDEFSERFQSDPRFRSFPICFNSPVWLAPDDLACSGEKQQPLSCSLQTVSELASSTDFTHAIVIADRGVANVHNGVMFLDKEDDYKVFLHELAHFAGFIDEYEIDELVAKKLCLSGQAPNLVYAANKPLISGTEFAQYQNKYEKIVLTKTATCDQTTGNAYKPVKHTTFMEHHDVGVIPDLYLKIWRDSLNDKLSLTPIYVNFAQWYESTGDYEQAGYWWYKYKNFRS